MAEHLTYAFEDGQNYAIRNGEVIAAASDLDELEQKVGAYQAISTEPRDATHIITPNGLKGKILGRVDELWGESVTVRLENGRIAHLNVTPGCNFTTEVAKTASSSSLQQLEQRLASIPDSDKASLQARREELAEIRHTAANLTSKASDSELARIDTIIVTADLETQEVDDSLAHLDAEDARGFELPERQYQAVEQESIGGDGSWLDGVVQEMVDEAEGRDFEGLMDEGPEMFVSDMETAPLADAGVTRQMASKFITTKTAGVLDADIVEKYKQTFLARVEGARRVELASRTVETRKQAAAEIELPDMPDDFLW